VGLAHAFAEAGARVVLSARRADELERVRHALPGQGHAVVPLDVSRPDALPELVTSVRQRCGRIDVLVCNAGVSQRSRFADTSLDVFRRIIEVNLLGVAAHIHAVLPAMRGQGTGHVVVTSSVAGKFGIPNRSAYCASKHAIHGLCDALRAEHAHEGIRFSTLVIAAVRSNVNANAYTAEGGQVGAGGRSAYSGGMDARVAGRRMVAALARGAQEINVVPNWRAALPLWQQRLWPPLVYRRMAKLARSKWWV
jgi:NADP-dependent 3-hydroxy acid dehydrogenase YdfG